MTQKLSSTPSDPIRQLNPDEFFNNISDEALRTKMRERLRIDTQSNTFRIEAEMTQSLSLAELQILVNSFHQSTDNIFLDEFKKRARYFHTLFDNQTEGKRI